MYPCGAVALVEYRERLSTGSLSYYLLALRGRAGMLSEGNPLALSLKRAIGKPLGKDPRIHSSKLESLLNSMLVPPMKQGVFSELLVECRGAEGICDPTPYQRCFIPPPVAGSEDNNHRWESQDRHTLLSRYRLHAHLR